MLTSVSLWIIFFGFGIIKEIKEIKILYSNCVGLSVYEKRQIRMTPFPEPASKYTQTISDPFPRTGRTGPGLNIREFFFSALFRRAA
jgi:hypothetical protein